MLEPLSYRKISLREEVINALEFIGVQSYSDFDLKSSYFNNPERGIHDARHLYRVMIAAALIAKNLNEPRRGLLAFCGAFLHDQARNDNGEDRFHGPRAAMEKWSPVHEKYGMFAFRIDKKWGILKVVDGRDKTVGYYDVEYF